MGGRRKETLASGLLVLFWASVTCGCAGGGGKNWLRAEAHEATTSKPASRRSETEEEPHWARSEPALQNPRVTEIVSLGSTYWDNRLTGAVVGAPVRRRQLAAPSSPIGSFRPWGYGYPAWNQASRWRGRRLQPFQHPFGSPWFSAPRRRIEERRRTPPIGGDWPAVPDYGPAFPFKAPPADPWAD